MQDPDTLIYHGATPIPGTIVVNVGDLLCTFDPSSDTALSALTISFPFYSSLEQQRPPLNPSSRRRSSSSRDGEN